MVWAYPIAILVVLLLVQVLTARAGADIAPAQVISPLAPPVTITVETSDESGQSWRAGLVTQKTGMLLTRYRTPDGQSGLATDSSTLPPGSLVLAVGSMEQLKAGTALLGQTSP